MWGVEGQVLGFLASALEDGQNAVGYFTQTFFFILWNKTCKITIDILS